MDAQVEALVNQVQTRCNDVRHKRRQLEIWVRLSCHRVMRRSMHSLFRHLRLSGRET